MGAVYKTFIVGIVIKQAKANKNYSIKNFHSNQKTSNKIFFPPICTKIFTTLFKKKIVLSRYTTFINHNNYAVRNINTLSNYQTERATL